MKPSSIFSAAVLAALLGGCLATNSEKSGDAGWGTASRAVAREIVTLGQPAGIGFRVDGRIVSLRDPEETEAREEGIHLLATLGDSILLTYLLPGSAVAWETLTPVLDSLLDLNDSAAMEEYYDLGFAFEDAYWRLKWYGRDEWHEHPPCSFSGSGTAQGTGVVFSQVTLSDSGIVFRIDQEASGAGTALVGKTFTGTLHTSCSDPRE